MNVEAIENGTQEPQGVEHQEDSARKTKYLTKWWLILLSCILVIVGVVGGPVLIRLYYLHGGNRKWMGSWLQSVGCPILLLPIAILYLRDPNSGGGINLAPPKLMAYSAAVGLIYGTTCLAYSYGLSFVPVSTVALLISTNLVFTAFFAFLIVKQKFTSYSINSIVLMISGAILLGISKNSDRLPGVSNAEYFLGFFLTLLASVLTGLMLPCCEFAYARAGKDITYPVVLQFTFGVNLVATVFSTIGMLINKDFVAIPREASEFELGVTKYYVLLASNAVIWQLVLLGGFGVIFYTSSLTSGVFSAFLLPIQEIASVIVFHDKFTGEKGLSLVLCIWGFTSYFYGAYREIKKKKNEAHSETELATDK